MTTMSVFVHGVYHLVQFVAGWPLPRKVELPIGVIFVATQLFSMGIGSVVGGTAHLAAATAAVILVSLAFVDHTTSFAYGNAWIFSVSTFVGIRMGGRGGARAREDHRTRVLQGRCSSLRAHSPLFARASCATAATRLSEAT